MARVLGDDCQHLDRSIGRAVRTVSTQRSGSGVESPPDGYGWRPQLLVLPLAAALVVPAGRERAADLPIEPVLGGGVRRSFLQLCRKTPPLIAGSAGQDVAGVGTCTSRSNTMNHEIRNGVIQTRGEPSVARP